MKKGPPPGTIDALEKWASRNLGADRQRYECHHCNDRGVTVRHGSYADHPAWQEPQVIEKAQREYAAYAQPCPHCALGNRIAGRRKS